MTKQLLLLIFITVTGAAIASDLAHKALVSKPGDISGSGFAAGACVALPAYGVRVLAGCVLASHIPSLSSEKTIPAKAELLIHACGLGTAIATNGLIASLQRRRIRGYYETKTKFPIQWDRCLAEEATKKHPGETNVHIIDNEKLRLDEEMTGKSSYLFYKSFFWGGTIGQVHCSASLLLWVQSMDLHS